MHMSQNGSFHARVSAARSVRHQCFGTLTGGQECREVAAAI